MKNKDLKIAYIMGPLNIKISHLREDVFFILFSDIGAVFQFLDS